MFFCYPNPQRLFSQNGKRARDLFVLEDSTHDVAGVAKSQNSYKPRKGGWKGKNPNEGVSNIDKLRFKKKLPFYKKHSGQLFTLNYQKPRLFA